MTTCIGNNLTQGLYVYSCQGVGKGEVFRSRKMRCLEGTQPYLVTLVVYVAWLKIGCGFSVGDLKMLAPEKLHHPPPNDYKWSVSDAPYQSLISDNCLRVEYALHHFTANYHFNLAGGKNHRCSGCNLYQGIREFFITSQPFTYILGLKWQIRPRLVSA